MKIISLGANCSISYVLERLELKGVSGLFEWFQCLNLDDVTTVIETLHSLEIELTSEDGKVCMNTKSIFSYHYLLEEYVPIFNRRKERFLTDLKNNHHTVLFIRKDLSLPTSLEQIQRLKRAIALHNKELPYKILLISDVEKHQEFKEIQDENLIHRYILKSSQPSEYWDHDSGDITIWKNFLIEAGHDCTPNTIKNEIQTPSFTCDEKD